MDADRFDAVTHSVHPRARRRLSLLAPTLALMAMLLVAGPALSALRIGTNGPDTLTGTKANDQLTGKEGEDILKGLSGNDIYYFADNFSIRDDFRTGFDTLIERSGEGSDTVNFRGVKTGPVSVFLEREWAQAGFGFAGYNAAFGPRGKIQFSYTNAGTVVQSFVEKAIGGQGDSDVISGGGGPNTIQPGGGATDTLQDHGGYNSPTSGLPPIPASNDVFKGFGDNTGTDTVADWGGTADVLDLRPFSTEDVYFDAVDFTTETAGNESLQIVTGPTSQVVVLGQFGPYYPDTNQQGRIEKLIFADTTITDTKTLSQVSAASAEAVSAEALSPKQAELAEAAEGLAKEARALLSAMPEPGSQRINPGAGGRHAGPRTGTDPDKDHGTADRGKSTQKDKKEENDKKHNTREKKHSEQVEHDKRAKPGKRHGLQRGTDRVGLDDTGRGDRIGGRG